MLLKKNFNNLYEIIVENTFICTISIILFFLFSDLASINTNLKINFLQFFLISNFFVELSSFDKDIFFFKSNIYNISIFFSILFQIYFFSLIFINLNKKFTKIFYLIFIISLFFFLFNLLSFNYNFLPFDKLWVIFLLKNYLSNVLVIKLNRITLSIFILSIINYYININILFYLILSISILFIPINKFNIPYKIIFFINVLAIIFLLKANLLITIVKNSDKNFNLHFNLSKNLFSENHFNKIKIDKKINKFYDDKCIKNDPKCFIFQKHLILSFGDTQMHQFLKLIYNSKNLNLIYLDVHKQCLLSNELKHTSFIKFYLNLDRVKDCSETFQKMKSILIESEQIKNNKIILLSSWYNWYFKKKLILNKKNQTTSEESAYKILSNELNIFLKSFENRSDLKFVFILPLPRFRYSPNACALNDEKCLIKFSEYENQISELSSIYMNLKSRFNNLEILETGQFFCNKNLDYCSMKGSLNQNQIHYRDLENLSQTSNLNFFNSVKSLR